MDKGEGMYKWEGMNKGKGIKQLEPTLVVHRLGAIHHTTPTSLVRFDEEGALKRRMMRALKGRCNLHLDFVRLVFVTAAGIGMGEREGWRDV